jgi:inorganic pyrophosphatase
MTSPYQKIPAFTNSKKHLHVIIETPKGSRNKFALDEELQVFKLKHVLPEGASFPYDFGFIPQTLAEDGDPIDVLVLMDAPAFAGCLVEVHIIGALEAEQTQKGKTVRNDRLLAVTTESRQHKEVKHLKDLPKSLLEEIAHFFVSYNEARDIEFKIIGKAGPKEALKLVTEAHQEFKHKAKHS